MIALPLIFILGFYLYFLELQMIVRTLFQSHRRVETWLDWAVPRWSRAILGMISLYTGTHLALPLFRRGQVPDHFLLVSNHQSLVDILALFAMFPQHPLRFVGKNSLRFGFPAVTRTLKLGRHAFVQRSGDPVGSIQAVRAFSRRCQRLGKCPVIFPEGTRSKDGNLGEFKTGGFRTIADGTALPIVTMVVDGGYKMSSIRDLMKNGASFYKAKLLKVFDPPRSKQEVAAALAESRDLVAASLAGWRGTST